MAIEPTDVTPDVKGKVRITLGGVERTLSALRIDAADAWIEQLEAKLAEKIRAASDGSDQLILYSRQTNHAAIDLIVAYDRDGVLGGRDWIVANAWPEELFAALDALKVSALPFAPPLREAVMLIAEAIATAKAIALLAPPSTTNGHSRTGDLPQDHSKPRSRTRSSTTSGKQARSA